MSDDDGTLRVFVTLGTDHHPFTRLIEWIEDWIPPAGADVDILVQHGATAAPTRARAVDMLSVAELVKVLAGSDLIVTQGGPGGIMDARRAGIVPIAVPRLPELDEVVDGHQVTFTRHLATLGTLRLAESREELHRALSEGVSDPERFRCPPLRDNAAETAAAVGAAVAAAVARRQSARGLRARLAVRRR